MNSPARRAPSLAAILPLLLLPLAPSLSRAADPAPGGLDGALRAIVEATTLGGARTGILVADAASGKVLYARDADVLLNPASNVKLFTSAAALARLGPEYRFATEFLVDPGGVAGRTVKTLYVRGKGDPTLVNERLWGIAGELRHMGIDRIGALVVDDSFFDAAQVGPGFDQEGGDRAYLAPTGALSLDFNTVTVLAGPGDRVGARGRIELEPATDLFVVENRTTTVKAKGRRRVTISSELVNGRQRIVVEGRLPLGSRPQAARRKIDAPALYFGSALERLLALRGVKVGDVRPGVAPPAARLVYVAQSESLAEIVRRLNKTSNNFIAEQILETLGAEAKGAPGSWAKGVAAVGDFLEGAGIPRGSYVMQNGSGLNDTNRFSARQVVALLRHVYARFPLQAEYLSSLPIAGRDGTIRWRMEGTEAAGRLRAKTGTLENVTSLSGYVENAAHQVLAFSILVNDYPGRHAQVVRAVDALGGAMAASGGAPGAPGAIAAAVALAKAPEAARTAVTPAALAQAVGTSYALGRAADPRNVAALSDALRAQTDPALRLAIAESMYLSDPGSETARHGFLEAISADPQVMGRLWFAAAGGTTPVLPSLGDVAAEGAPDALAKLVELAPAAALDGRLAAAIADTLAEVAASAPSELVDALRAAPPAAADAALGALGTGLARSDEADHPFPAALRALGAKQDALGAFARGLLPRLEQATRAAAAVQTAPTLVPASTAAPAR